MAKRARLDELYENALAAIKRAQALEPGAGQLVLDADREFLRRCKHTTRPGTTRGHGPLRSGFVESLKDPAIAKDYADYVLEDVYQPDVLRRCKEMEGVSTVQDREDRQRQKLRRGALDLEKTSYNGPAAIERKAAGKEVILYAKVDPKETPGVYLSARYGGRGSGVSNLDALGYADRAARWLGGKPMVLTVRVPWSDLTWDTDDEDISSGNWQFVTDHVPPEAIIEIDGVPRKELL
jgi:hypothetical protein